MATSGRALDRLRVLLGEWSMESVKLGGRGHTTVDMTDGDMFVRIRTSPMEGEFPSSTWIIGSDESSDELTCLYWDSRGVGRVYRTKLVEGVWTIWRNAPRFNQRYIGNLAADGSSIDGRWEFSEDGSMWKVDFDLSYHRRP